MGASMDELARTREELIAELIVAHQKIAALEQTNRDIMKQITQHKEIEKELLTARVEAEKAKAKAIKLAEIDYLTGLLNRRAFIKRLSGELSRSKRTKIPVSIIFADIDHFKAINDTYGHLVGDSVLKNFARLLAKMCRNYDFIARYGGEEFIICLPGSSSEQSLAIARRINRALWDWHVKLDSGERVYITSSFGVATSTGDKQETAYRLILKADQALYKAKANGRNRVENY